VEWSTIAIMIGLAAFAAVLFGWNLSTMPPEAHGDDAEVGLDAIRLLARFNLFEAGWFELPRFHALPTAVGVYLFGNTRLGLRFPSLVLGVAAVLVLFALARRLWNTEVALTAALLLAAQRFFIQLSRAAGGSPGVAARRRSPRAGGQSQSGVALGDVQQQKRRTQ